MFVLSQYVYCSPALWLRFVPRGWMAVKGSLGVRPSIIWSIRELDVQATLENFVVCFVQNRRGPGGTFEKHLQRDLWYFCPIIDCRRAKRAVWAWDLIASNVFALITSQRHLRSLWQSIPSGLWFILLLLSDFFFVDFIYCSLYPFYELSITSSLQSDVCQQY